MPKRLPSPLRIVSLALLISLLLSGAGVQSSAPAAQAEAIAHVVPGQFIAKIHTEALGRAPTTAEWQYWFETFSNSDNCEQTVKDAVYQFYTSPDFFQRYPDEEPDRQREAQLLALFRGALNQELAQGALDTYMSGSWPTLPFTATVADVLYDNSTWAPLFASIVHNICDVGTPPWYENAPYGWRDPPVVTLTPLGPYITNTWVFCGAFCDENGDDLQGRLYDAAATPTKTVYLAQKAVVRITDTLTIPAGVTLTTWHEANLPSLAPDCYALMGRLVRASRFDAPMIVVETCGTLQGVWVDGQKKQLEPRLEGASSVVIQDVSALSQCQTRLVDNRLTDPLGWTLVQAFGVFETAPAVWGCLHRPQPAYGIREQASQRASGIRSSRRAEYRLRAYPCRRQPTCGRHRRRDCRLPRRHRWSPAPAEHRPRQCDPERGEFGLWRPGG